MSKKLKALMVQELQTEFRGLNRCVVVGLSGIPAGTADKVRADLESKKVRLTVVKNTLAAVALKEVGLSGIDQYLKGPSAIITGGTDIVDLAKRADELARVQAGVVIKGGFGEGKVLSPQDIEALSKMPGKQEMLGQLAYALSATMSNFASVLGGVQRNFLYALKGLEEKSGAAA